MIEAPPRSKTRDLLATINDNTFLERVPISAMFVDAYARAVGMAQIGRMLKRGYREDLLGIITLSLRNDGRYAILDGNHRKNLAQICGEDEMLSRVFIDLTYEQEAEMFSALNTIKPPTALDNWRARKEYRDAAALEITEVLDRVGLHVGQSHKNTAPGVILCVSSLDSVYSSYGTDTLQEVLMILRAAWDLEPSAYSGKMVMGVTVFWARYREQAVMDRLVQQLRQTTPHQILGAAGQLSNSLEPARTAVGKQIAAVYTGRSRRYILPDWKHFADSTMDRSSTSRRERTQTSDVARGRSALGYNGRKARRAARGGR